MSNETIFDGSKDQQNGENDNLPPVLANKNEGVAAWLEKDKNGNTYVSVSLPLGLGSVCLFANDPKNDSTVTQVLNQLHQHLHSEGRA